MKVSMANQIKLNDADQAHQAETGDGVGRLPRNWPTSIFIVNVVFDGVPGACNRDLLPVEAGLADHREP